MTDTEYLQQIIATGVAKDTGRQILFNGYQIEIEWYKEDVPLRVQDEIVGEWRLVRIRRYFNGGCRAYYSYYRAQPRYCVRLYLEGTPVEVPGTRSHDEVAALAIAHNLNATILGAGRHQAPPLPSVSTGEF